MCAKLLRFGKVIAKIQHDTILRYSIRAVNIVICTILQDKRPSLTKLLLCSFSKFTVTCCIVLSEQRHIFIWTHIWHLRNVYNLVLKFCWQHFTINISVKKYRNIFKNIEKIRFFSNVKNIDWLSTTDKLRATLCTHTHTDVTCPPIYYILTILRPVPNHSSMTWLGMRFKVVWLNTANDCGNLNLNAENRNGVLEYTCMFLCFPFLKLSTYYSRCHNVSH